MSWTFSDLKKWDDRIIEIAHKYKLDWFNINYEVCDYYEMIGHMSYHGMPSHYNHWSYGKSFERTHQMYNMGMEGLPYELIINSDPSIAYLMKQNDLYLQILIMAHCVGHSDFFKNNRMFKETRPESVVSRFRNAKKRIQEYCENPHIGYDRVENFLDALHSIKFQTERSNIPRQSRKEIKQSIVDDINRKKNKSIINTADIGLLNYDFLNSSLLKPDRDLLAFFIEYGNFDDWKVDLINIVREDSQYFIPQVKTKILNEGWASFWHYKILHELNLPQEYHIPFLKMHNAVVRPHIGSINPYHVGFYLFNKIYEEKGLDECFLIRETHDDVAAVRAYLTLTDYRELNFFSFSNKKKVGKTIDEVSDESGYKEIQKDLIRNIGINSVPLIYAADLTGDGTLILEHDHDGRDLDLHYADEVLKAISENIWPGEVKFLTVVEDDIWEI